MKKALIFLTIALITINVGISQQTNAKINFEKLVHDYGQINEEKGSVDYKFVFSNSGNKPLLVKNVKPSCGCTTSDYTKQPIPPGGKGFINARYDPKNRPGKFNKTITINTNGDIPTTVLRIAGEVIPKPKSIEDIYPKALTLTRMSKDHVAFTKIFSTEIKNDDIKLINTSNKLVKIEFEKIPEHISLIVTPNVLKPNETGKITVKYDATKVNDYGFIIHKVLIMENGVINKKNRLTISANINEDFSFLTETELANSPIVNFDKRTFNFGTINVGDVVNTVFVLSNTGKSDLIIRKTKASCGCTVVQPEKNIIHPGESINIKAAFNSRGRKGKQSKNIAVTTNDPKSPVVNLKITGSINATN